MTDVRGELERELEEQFAAVRSHPGWPDPWPDRAVPDEAYSRVTDPERWRIGDDRAEAWARTVVALGVAERDDDGRTTALRPTAPGALGLLLVRHDLTLEVRVIGSDVPVMDVDCRCDACDSGSADYLQEIDDAIWNVVAGGFLRVDLGRGRWVMTTRGGLSGRGPFRGRMEEYVDAARTGRSRYPVVTGAAWW